MNHDQDQTFYLWYDFYWKWDCAVYGAGALQV